MTAQKDYPLANNQSWYDEIVLTNDEISPPAPHEFTEASRIRLQLRASATNDTVILQAEAGVNEQLAVLNVNAAKVRINFPAKEMRGIQAGTYVYDIIIAHPSGRVYRPVEGHVNLTHGVTELPT